MVLSENEKSRYLEEGYLILPGILDAETRAPYMSVFNELVDRTRSMNTPEGAFSLAPDSAGQPIPGRLHKVQGVCVEDERVLGLASEPAVLDRVECLIGPNIDMFGSKFFPMMTAGATSTGWHQDNHYFGTNTSRVVSCAMYLEATNRDNGCLMVLPGSHKTGELFRHESGGGVYAHGQWADVDESKAVDVICPAGTVVFFSANLLHGARANLKEPRKAALEPHGTHIPGDLQLEMFPRGGYRD